MKKKRKNVYIYVRRSGETVHYWYVGGGRFRRLCNDLTKCERPDYSVKGEMCEDCLGIERHDLMYGPKRLELRT